MKKFALLVSALVIALSLSACGATLKTAAVPSAAVDDESRKKEEIAYEKVKKSAEEGRRLDIVTLRLLRAAASMGCADTKRLAGFGLYKNEWVQPEFRQSAQRYFGQDNLIRYVVADTPAERAGLKAKDTLRTINGRSMDGLSEESWKEELKKGHIVLGVQRGETHEEISTDLVPICSYRPSISNLSQLKAYSEGKVVFVSWGMVRLATDDELAIVVGYELGRNLLNRLSVDRKEALAGTFFDLIAGRMETAEPVYRAYEPEADYASICLAATAGFDIDKGTGIWRRMAAENPGGIDEWYAKTHPGSSERYAGIDNTIREVKEKIRLGLPLFPEK